MDASFIKHLGIIAVSVYSCIKILNIKKISLYKYVWIGVFVILSTFLSYYEKAISDELYANIAYICTNFALLTVLFKIIFRYRWSLTVTVAVFSFAMSMLFFMIANVLVAFIIGFFFADVFGVKNTDSFDLHHSLAGYLQVSVTFAFQAIVAALPYRFKRLRNGFPFLKQKGAGFFAIPLSLFILFFATIPGLKFFNDFTIIFSLVCLGIISIIGFIWWRVSVTQEYIKFLQGKEIEEAKKTIALESEKMELLKERNQFLAGVIHRDNKLLPSLSLAVEEFINLAVRQLDEETTKQARLIQERIEAQSRERADVLSAYQTEVQPLPKTNVFSLDAVFEYLRRKAAKLGIVYDLLILCDVQFMVHEIISESSLETLLADLIDNAIYAVSSNRFKKIQTEICIEDDFYEVQVSDSGVDFNIDTLCNLGLLSVTTHEDDGGSGIGYMTIFNVLHEVNASIIIHEFENEFNGFTKSITVRFDGKNQYIIESPRASQIVNRCNRKIIFRNI